MSFRRNYLPRQTQAWAREVQSRIQGLEQDLTRDSINNRTRDDQLQASYNRLDLAFVDLASKQSTLEAQQIQINTALQDSTQALQDADTALQTAISANNTAISANSTAITANSNALAALQDVVDLGSPGGPTVNAANLTAGTITAVDISGVSIDGASISGGSIQAASTIDAGTMAADTGNFADVFAQNLLNSTGTYGRVVSQSPNVYIASNATFARSTSASSREIKENIEQIVFDSEAFLSINPVTFNYIEGVLTGEDDNPTLVGFIAEDFVEAGLSDYLVTPANEFEPTIGLKYDKLYMFLHKSVQEINERLKALENG